MDSQVVNNVSVSHFNVSDGTVEVDSSFLELHEIVNKAMQNSRRMMGLINFG
jgi:hypothetical protein